MPDMQKLQETKSKIVETIQTNGPSLPTKISQQTQTPPLFTSAYLAELVSEKKLKISNMKVGSSPIYYIKGQESKLENFIEHLNSKEREAFHLLKDSQVLEDEKQLPAIRVALRSIKDFAIPIQAKINQEQKLFWRFHLLNQQETKSKIQKIISPTNQKNISKQSTQSVIKPVPVQKTQSLPPNTKQDLSINNKANRDAKEQKLDIFDKSSKQTNPQRTKPQQESEFGKQIKSYLEKNNFEVQEILSEKKKEFISKISTDSKLGKQYYFLLAKDKKKITENDLVLALQKSQSEKMPAFLISPGELDKKAQTYLEEYKNLIKFQKL